MPLTNLTSMYSRRIIVGAFLVIELAVRSVQYSGQFICVMKQKDTNPLFFFKKKKDEFARFVYRVELFKIFGIL